MSDPKRAEETRPELTTGKAGERGGTVAAATVPTDSGASAATASEPATPNNLTPEEQMALFEKDLKENDWGHQPC